MSTARIRVVFAGMTLAIMLFAAATGCQQQTRDPQVQTDAQCEPEPQGAEPISVIAEDDTDRAEGAIERDRQERAAQRRPYDPNRGRVVDQPRVRR